MVAKTVAQDNQSVIAQKPVKWCSVPLYEVIQSGCRLDAGVYDIETRQIKETVLSNKYGCVRFSDIVSAAYYPGRFKRIYCKKGYGVDFYLPSQVNDVCPKAEKYISALTKCDISELKLNKDTLLLTRSGTIGNVAIVSKTTQGKVYSDDVIRVKFNDNLYIGYVYAYLKCDAGKIILTTNGYGSVITHLEPEHLDKIPIPNAPENIKRRINDLIIRSYDLRDESNTLLDNATAMLISELHLPPIEEFAKVDYGYSEKVKAFSVRLYDLDCRFDASYHLPIANAITKHLEKYAAEVTTIGNKKISKDIILAGIFKRTYVDKDFGYPFIGGNEITQLNPRTDKYLSRSIHKNRYNKELRIEKNMILVTDRGSIGISAFVPKHWSNFAVSQNVLKLVPYNDNIAGYLFVYLNTDIAKCLIEREIYGAVIDMIDSNSLSHVAFPLLKNKEVQKKINDLALRANDLRYQAYLLEQEALKVLNDEVIYAK